MKIATRALALAFVAATGLASCTTTTTTATNAPATSAASGGSTSTTAATSTTKPSTGVAELKVITTPFGKAIGQGDGKVLYAWDKEADGTVKCVEEACLMKWPPVLAKEVKVSSDLDAMLFTVIDRPDGTKQVALKGKPLYTMAVDEPGEANCQSVEGWWIQNPDGSKNTATDVVKP